MCGINPSGLDLVWICHLSEAVSGLAYLMSTAHNVATQRKVETSILNVLYLCDVYAMSL